MYSSSVTWLHVGSFHPLITAKGLGLGATFSSVAAAKTTRPPAPKAAHKQAVTAPKPTPSTDQKPDHGSQSTPNSRTPPKTAPKPDRSWTTVSRSRSHASTTASPPTKPKDPQRPALGPRELARVVSGLSPRPARRITGLYTIGLRANTTELIKQLLEGNCEINLRNVPTISFIGKSVGEFHVYVDYAETFKRKLLAVLPDVQFVDIDPLDPGLFKDEEVSDRVRDAATALIKRLEKRIAQTPTVTHRRFLAKELERAKTQLHTGEPILRHPKNTPTATSIAAATAQGRDGLPNGARASLLAPTGAEAAAQQEASNEATDMLVEETLQ